MSFTQASNVIRERTHFLVTAHVRADGDAIAAVCFMTECLRLMGKDARAILSDSNIDERYSFLPGFNSIQSHQTVAENFAAETAIVLDAPTLDRIGPVANRISRCPEIICIDHHPGNDNFAHINLIDVLSSSTCEILTILADYLECSLTPELATALYSGIVFDTGNFRFSNTSPSALRTAARLVDCGADPEIVSDRLFYRWSFLRTRAMAQVLQSIELLGHRKIGISCLSHAFFKSHPGVEHELEGFSDLAISIEGVQIAAFLKEFEPGGYKISLRSRGDWDVGSVAETFGGGGHRKAAGCHLPGDYPTVVANLMEVIYRINPGLRRLS